MVGIQWRFLGLSSQAAEAVYSLMWGLRAWDQHECGSKNSSWSTLLLGCVLLGQVLTEQFYPEALEGTIEF